MKYTYDAWGNILTVTGSMANTLGKENPLRYRGYVYDDETRLYYLQSRYYDPQLGRFINSDVYTSTGQGLLGNNMFAYGNNNPVLNADPAGNRAISLWDARAIHNEVARRVATQINGKEGVYVKKVIIEKGKEKTQRGFLDVYDPKTNSYYEIKSNLSADSSRTKHQMQKYDGSEPTRNSQGPITRGNAYVSGDFTYGIFDVTYSTKRAGLVSYTATMNPQRTATAALVVVAGIALSMYGGPVGALAIAFA